MSVGLRLLSFGLAVTAGVASAWAQPADLPIPAAQTTEFPAGISVKPLPGGSVYVDANGRTLYGMDMRTVLRWSADPAQYCAGRCDDWEPVLAPAGSVVNIEFPRNRGGAQEAPAGMVNPQKAPDWSVAKGPHGLQWVYKGWHMVYVRKDAKPGSTEFDGAQDFIWNTLKYVPPVPKLTAPGNVAVRFVDGGYIITDKGGAVLFTGACADACGRWLPFVGGAANRGVGQWTVSRSGDQPQWLLGGKPVFVAASGDPADLPAGAIALRP